MPTRPILPFADYERIYQVIYSVLEATQVAKTHGACFFFAVAGMTILRKHYGLPATFSVGTMALMVDAEKANVVVYGRNVGDAWVSDIHGFHAWVECRGWLIDFMAPIMGTALKMGGVGFGAPSHMLQKPLADRKEKPSELQHVGEFSCEHNDELAEKVLEGQPPEVMDLLDVCESWYRKPPAAMPAATLGGSDVQTPRVLQLRAPAITGSW